MYNIKIYETKNGNKPLSRFLSDLGKKHKDKDIAEIKLYVKHLEEYGYDINEHYPKSIKPLREGVWELRPSDNRVLFFYCNENKEYVLLHGFTKKTNKTPPLEIKKAIDEKNDYIRRT